MPEFGADDPGHYRQSNHAQCIGRLAFRIDDMIAAKAIVQHNRAANRRHPKHQAKGRDIPRTKRSDMDSNMDIRQHTYLSIVGGLPLAAIAHARKAAESLPAV